MLISIDPGKYATKAMSQSKRIYFPTRLSPNPTIEPAGNTYQLLFNNSSYIIGEQAETHDFDVSKASLPHKLATYTAITQLLGDECRVKLTVGCPLNIYKNKELRDEYKEYLLDDRLIKIAVNNIVHSFYIDNILILPEGAGVVYIYPNLFKNKRVAVIDLGGLNFNYCIYDNFVPQLSSMFTLNLGGNELQNSILNVLNSRYGIVLNIKDIPYIINQSGLKVKGKIDNDSILLVNSIIESYLQKIQQEIARNNFNLNTLDVCFVGGTSKLIENKILQHIPHAYVPDNAEWCNAEGFYKIGQIKYETT
jgi:plasmid segregation protein ParM